ncbi:YitT family protein [Treponema sp. Marseille-Q3903]|uniref:YczE/YyaS/YitT family protein n=1 Tax=Treponema sp. Marseille-Q3903 TaxID=2766703 RepID=UPI001651D74E|nr:hypothetical protein [Treponema sp. Marseille-Q3903]MBC6713251.1 hypothetical protein [Treponema sp. Marseille-Q3903]
MKFSFRQFVVPNLRKRLAFMLPAVILMGFFISLLIEVDWGIDPASFMNLNISHAIGLSLGNTGVIVYGLMLIFTFIFGHYMIGFGTIANMVLIGYTADFCRWIWATTGFHEFIQDGIFEIRLAIFIISIVSFVITAAIYMNAQLGIAPYDASAAIIAKWMPKIPYFIVRITWDFATVGIGVVAAQFSPDGMQGSLIGSIVMSILIGPAVQLIEKPLRKIL